MKNWAHLEHTHTGSTPSLRCSTHSTCACLAPPPPHLSSASLKCLFWTSNWKTVLSQSVEALSLPPCFFRKASKPFSAGYFWLPMNTTERRRCTTGTRHPSKIKVSGTSAFKLTVFQEVGEAWKVVRVTEAAHVNAEGSRCLSPTHTHTHSTDPVIYLDHPHQ